MVSYFEQPMNQPSRTLHSTVDNLQVIAKALLGYAGNQKIWLFEGEMGAGKTTLIKALCSQLGVQGSVNSPTFSLISEYTTSSGTLVYHFDFYRLEHEEEALALDCTAYFDSGNYCFIEWPSKVSSLIPPTHCQVCLANQPNGSRVLQFSLRALGTST